MDHVVVKKDVSLKCLHPDPVPPRRKSNPCRKRSGHWTSYLAGEWHDMQLVDSLITRVEYRKWGRMLVGDITTLNIPRSYDIWCVWWVLMARPLRNGDGMLSVEEIRVGGPGTWHCMPFLSHLRKNIVHSGKNHRQYCNSRCKKYLFSGGLQKNSHLLTSIFVLQCNSHVSHAMSYTLIQRPDSLGHQNERLRKPLSRRAWTPLRLWRTTDLVALEAEASSYKPLRSRWFFICLVSLKEASQILQILLFYYGMASPHVMNLQKQLASM